MITRLPAGKVPWDLISSRLRSDLPSDVLLGPGHGEDAALVRIGGETWAIASDPVSFTSTDAGRLCVWVNANDIAVRGAEPRMFLAVVLVSPGQSSVTEIEQTLDSIRESCERLGVSLIGGHTEITPGLPRTMVVGTMLGPVAGRPVTTASLRPGDRIALSGWAAMEGTSILHREFGDRFDAVAGTPPLRNIEEIAGGEWMLVVREAAAAAAIPGVSAMHDVTEGGVGEALHEMGSASGLHLEIDRDAIPVLPETVAICEALGIDPLGLIGSGALLIGCAEEDAGRLEGALNGTGKPFNWIGQAVRRRRGSSIAVPRFPRDEIIKAGIFDGMVAILFDMDGTLVDSRYDWKGIRESLDLSGPSIIDELNSLSGAEGERKWNVLREIERRATRQARLVEDVPQLLAFLGEKGILTALVTNNSLDNTEYLLAKFSLGFDTVVTRDSGKWKPSGAPLTEAMKRLGVPPERTLEVGDSHYDVRSAREAGCGAVCVIRQPGPEFTWETDLAFADIRSFLRYLRIVAAD